MNKATKSDINQQASDESHDWPTEQVVEYMLNRPGWEDQLRNDFEALRRNDLEFDGDCNEFFSELNND